MGAAGSKPFAQANVAEGQQNLSLGAQLLADFEGTKDAQALAAAAKGQGLTQKELEELDQRVRASIVAEAKRLHKAEADVRHQIELQLEKESLAKEQQLPSTATSSARLQEQLDVIQAQVKAHAEKRAKIAESPEIVAAREKIASCYKYVVVTDALCRLECRNAL